MLVRILITLFLLTPISCLVAQGPDSVTVTGQIYHLTAQLYRQNSTVAISRTNILQASRELTRLASLEPDGRFRVTLPLIYPYEELYFNYGPIATAFLASPGTLEITLDADSLFQTEIPFRFTGINAQVNNALAHYKAFEYRNRKLMSDNQELSRQLHNQPAATSWQILTHEYEKLYTTYRRTNVVLPVLDTYIRSTIRYDAAIFLYEKALTEDITLPTSLADSLRPLNDQFLSAQRAIALERFASYASARIDKTTPLAEQRTIPIRTFATLIDQYVTDLTEADRVRIQELKTSRNGKNRDWALLEEQLEQHSDTLSKLIDYETTMVHYSRRVDSTALTFLKPYFLATELPLLSFRHQQLLYKHIAPQVADERLRQSLEELYRLEVADSTTIRKVTEQVSDPNAIIHPTEVLPQVFLLRDINCSGRQLLDQIKKQGQGRLIYVLTWTSNTEQSRQEVLLANQLAQNFLNRDILFVYLCGFNSDPIIWQEWIAKNRPAGLHVFANDSQTEALAGFLRLNDAPSATLIGSNGSYLKRYAPLPSNSNELVKLIRESI